MVASSSELLDALAGMAELIPGRRNGFGALGYGIGRRMKQGKVSTERVVVVFVARKSASPRRQLPREVPGTRVPIDVVALGPSGLAAEELALPEPVALGAASPLALRAGAWHCSAGFGVPFDAPEYLLSVGHPFAEQAAGASVFSFRRRIGELASDPAYRGSDLALIRLDDPGSVEASLPSGDALSGSGTAQFLHLGASLCFYSPVRGTLVRPRVLALRITAFLLPWGGVGTVKQEHLVMTEGATSPGDSGAPLFDSAGTVIGLASFRTDQFSFFESVGQGRVEQLLTEVD